MSSKTKSTYHFGLYVYQPNLVARKFGLVQPKPNSLYKCLDELKQPLVEHVWRELLRQVQERAPTFDPASYTLSYACTEAFIRWW